MTNDLVVVGGGRAGAGGGPAGAGAGAAIFAGRAGLRTAVIDDGIGVAPKALVNNHLGLPDGVEGPELLKLGRRHAVACARRYRGAQIALPTTSTRSRTRRKYPPDEHASAPGSRR